MATGSSWIRLYDGIGRLMAVVNPQLRPILRANRLGLEDGEMKALTRERYDLLERRLRREARGPRDGFWCLVAIVMIAAGILLALHVGLDRQEQMKGQGVYSPAAVAEMK